jgi:uncharacterized protein YkwD
MEAATDTLGRAMRAAALAAVVLASACAEEVKLTPKERRAVDRLNELRRGAGLAEVTVDSALASGCDAHAGYMVAHDIRVEKKATDEDPASAGFTEAGRVAARASLIRWDEPEPMLARLVAAPAWRAKLLDPALERIGIGSEPDVRGG